MVDISQPVLLQCMMKAWASRGTDMNGGDRHAAGRDNQDDRRRAVSVYDPYHFVQHEVGISRGTLKKYLAYWALSRSAFLLARAASPFRKKRWPG
jgi:hypothetical protein